MGGLHVANKGKGEGGGDGGGAGWGQAKEPASQCARVCQDYLLAKVSPRKKQHLDPLPFKIRSQ